MLTLSFVSQKNIFLKLVLRGKHTIEDIPLLSSLQEIIGGKNFALNNLIRNFSDVIMTEKKVNPKYSVVMPITAERFGAL